MVVKFHICMVKGMSLRGPPPGLDGMNHHPGHQPQHRGIGPPPGHGQHRPEWGGGGANNHMMGHHPQHQQQPAPHVNPAFFPPPAVGAGIPPPGFPPPPALLGQPPPFIPSGVAGGMVDPSGRSGANHLNSGQPDMIGGVVQQQPVVSEAEFEEVMVRNRTVSSSAIARAVNDASAGKHLSFEDVFQTRLDTNRISGDYGSAIETLVTAISLIKQSKVAHDERCKILVSSLQDTLHGIEAKSYSRRGDERFPYELFMCKKCKS